MNIKCAYTELVPVHKLVEHPKNNNSHPEKQIERLAKIIDFQGMRSPIVVSKLSGFITKGHGRLAALKKLGWEEVPVDYQEYESEAQEFADITADNEIARWAELDQEKLLADLEGLEIDTDLLGIEDFKLPEIEVLEPLTDEDDVPEVKESRVKRGDIWKLGNHRLMCGDSTMIDDVEKLMNGEKADILITDPPYNYASETSCSKNNKGENQLKNAEWDKNFNPENVLFFDFLKENFSAYIFTSAFLFGDIFKIAGKWSSFKGMMCWKKTTYNSNLIKKHPTWNIEPIVYATKGGHIFNYDKSNAKNALLEFAVEHSTRFVGHPSQKPIKMIESLLENSSIPDFLCIDLFLGSGSTLIACEKTNRKCYGMELDEHYCEVILSRWEQYTGRKAERIENE